MTRRAASDPYAGRRDEDRWQHFVAMFFVRLVWPITVFAITLLVLVTYVYVKYGEDRLTAFLHFAQTPAVLGAVGIVITVCGRVVAAVPQLGRIDRRQGQLSQQAAVSAKRVDNMAVFVTELGGKVDKLDERLDAIADGKAAAEYETIRHQLAALTALVERQGAQVGRAVVAITGSQQAVPSAPHVEAIPAHVTGATALAEQRETTPDPFDTSRPWLRENTGTTPAVRVISGDELPPPLVDQPGQELDAYARQQQRWLAGETGTMASLLPDLPLQPPDSTDPNLDEHLRGGPDLYREYYRRGGDGGTS